MKGWSGEEREGAPFGRDRDRDTGGDGGIANIDGVPGS